MLKIMFSTGCVATCLLLFKIIIASSQDLGVPVCARFCTALRVCASCGCTLFITSVFYMYALRITNKQTSLLLVVIFDAVCLFAYLYASIIISIIEYRGQLP